MVEPNSTSFGRYLKAARMEKGISLEEVSQKTRIRLDMLVRIEEENHAELPAEVFVKGFLRAYAKAVGADDDEVVRRYGERCVLDENAECMDIGARAGRDRFWTRLLGGLVILAVIIGLSIYIGRSGFAPKKSSPAATSKKAATPAAKTAPAVHKAPAVSTARTRKPAVGTAAPAPRPKPAATVGTKPAPTVHHEAKAHAAAPSVPEKRPEQTGTPPPTAASTPASRPAASAPAPATAPKPAVHIAIRAVEDTWLKIIVDNLPPHEFYLKPGERIERDAEHGINLLIGNATGIELTMNGKRVPIPGKTGQVVTLQLP